MLLFRSVETACSYLMAKTTEKPVSGCRLCDDEDIIAEYQHWRLLPNRFPYDRYFATCHLLIPKRHVREPELSDAEREELFALKTSELTDQYDLVFENLPKQQSIPHHYHLHLTVIKDAPEIEIDTLAHALER